MQLELLIDHALDPLCGGAGELAVWWQACLIGIEMDYGEVRDTPMSAHDDHSPHSGCRTRMET